MTRRPGRWLLLLSGIASVTGTSAVLLGNTSDGRALALDSLAWVVFPVVCWAVGATIVGRANGHVVGWLLAAAGVLAAGVIGGGGFITDPVLLATPAATWAILVVTAAYGPFFVTLIMASMLLFPDGRLPGRAWRLPALLPISMVVVATVALVLRLGPFESGLPDNPIGVEFLPAELLGSLYVLDPLGIALLGLTGAASLVWRFRRGTPKVRAQLKWLLASVVPAVILTPISFFETDQSTSSVADILSGFTLLLIPVCIGIAITRHRLYEIDRLISRTIGWAIVTGVLVAVFAGLVVGLQAILASVTQGQTLAVAASTLAAFALFQPLRGRLQHLLDRRFDRARYDAEQTMELFAERIRNEVDLGTLRADVEATAERSLRPLVVGLWFRADGRTGR